MRRLVNRVSKLSKRLDSVFELAVAYNLEAPQERMMSP
jgi:hypothetical protein